jgi:hypothetical protein
VEVRLQPMAARVHAHDIAPLELAGARQPEHSGGWNSPIFLLTGAVGCEEHTKGHHGGSGH